MPLDRMTSYNDQSGQTYSFGQNAQTNQRAQPTTPFSKDILEAIQTGNTDLAMKLLEAEKAFLLQQGQFYQFMGMLKKGIMFGLKLPAGIFKYGADKPERVVKVEAPRKSNESKNSNSVSKTAQNLLDQIKAAIVNPVHNVIKAMTNKITQFHQNKILPPLQIAAQAIQKAYHVLQNSVKAVWNPIAQFTNKQVEAFANVVDRSWSATKEYYSKAVEKVVAVIEPLRTKVADLGKGIAERFIDAKDWFKERSDKVLDPVKEIFSKINEVVQETLRETIPEYAAEVRDKIAEMAQASWQALQNIPANVVPYAFWMANKVAGIPMGNIPHNIMRFARGTKQFAKWLGERGAKGFVYVQRLYTGFTTGLHYILDWLENVFFPFCYKILKWIYDKIVHFVVICYKVLEMAAVSSYNRAKRIILATPAFLKSLLHRFDRLVYKIFS